MTRRPIDPHELAALTGDVGAVDQRSRPVHLRAEDFDDEPASPSWRLISIVAFVALVLVPAFLTYCGSIR